MCIHVAPGEIPDHAGQPTHFFSLCLGTSLHYDMHQDARQLHRPGPPFGTGHASHLSCNSLVIKKHVLFSCRRVILPYHAHLPACLLLACLISSTHLPRHAFTPPLLICNPPLCRVCSSLRVGCLRGVWSFMLPHIISTDISYYSFRARPGRAHVHPHKHRTGRAIPGPSLPLRRCVIIALPSSTPSYCILLHGQDLMYHTF